MRRAGRRRRRKLSRSFYEKLGDDVANELVDWFNKVDTTYRSELKEQNDLNFARFDAKLEQRVAELRQEMKAGFADLRTEIANLRADLVKWMFLFWVGTALTVIGLVKF